MCAIGSTFHFRTVGSHLWMVFTEPGSDGNFLIVAMTTLDEEVDDESCVLEAGDHPFIHHRSVIYYKDVKPWNASGFRQAQQNGLIIPRPPLDAPILLRIQRGALVSEHFKRKYRALVELSMQ